MKSLVSKVSLEGRDAVGRTPLMLATINGHLSAVEWLVSEGAAVAPKLTCGRNALHFAAQYGKTEILRVLSTLR